MYAVPDLDDYGWPLNPHHHERVTGGSSSGSAAAVAAGEVDISFGGVPRGFDPAHPRADLLRRKGLMVTFPALPAELLPSRRLVDWLVRHVLCSAPLVEWLAPAGE